MSDVITRFAAGDDIPEWLLVAEPMQPTAPRGRFQFGSDCYIVDLPEAYLAVGILPHANQPLVDNTGMLAHRIYAPGKQVAIVRMLDALQPLSVDAWAPQCPPFTLDDSPHRAVPAPGAPPRGFWARLRYLCLGQQF